MTEKYLQKEEAYFLAYCANDSIKDGSAEHITNNFF